MNRMGCELPLDISCPNVIPSLGEESLARPDRRFLATLAMTGDALVWQVQKTPTQELNAGAMNCAPTADG